MEYFIGFYTIGTIFHYDLVVTNTDDTNAATDVFVDVTTPNWIEYKYSTGQGSYNTGIGRHTIGTILPETSVVITFWFEVTEECVDATDNEINFRIDSSSVCLNCVSLNCKCIKIKGFTDCDMCYHTMKGPVKQITEDTTADSADFLISIDTTSNDVTYTLPAPETEADCKRIRVITWLDGGNVATVETPSGTIILDNPATATGSYIIPSLGDTIWVITIGNNYKIIN